MDKVYVLLPSHTRPVEVTERTARDAGACAEVMTSCIFFYHDEES